eukprot:770869-Amphidinium_carterae.2
MVLIREEGEKNASIEILVICALLPKKNECYAMYRDTKQGMARFLGQLVQHACKFQLTLTTTKHGSPRG